MLKRISALLAMVLFISSISTTAMAIECGANEQCASCEPKVTEPWSGTFGIGVHLAQGNTDTSLYNFSLSTSYEQDAHNADFDANSRYGEDDDEESVNDGRLDISYHYIFSGKWYGIIGADAFRDEIADVKYRTSIYPGLGYYFIKTPSVKLNVDIGPAFVAEKQGDDDNQFIAGRVNQNFEWKFSESAKFAQEVQATVSTEDVNNSLILATIGIEAQLTNVLSLSQTIENRYDNQPADDSLRNDILIITALHYSF